MKTLLKVILLFFVVYGCEHEADTNRLANLELRNLVNALSPDNTSSRFIMPESFQFDLLPNQDKKNPLTNAKVELGKLLFFETGLALEPKYPVSTSTYSCSSCHIPSRGFTAGRFQGIADGALGIGRSGEGRNKNMLYLGSDVDAQGARPLPTINLTYVTNALWAGSFGSFGTNTGTSSVWKQDTLIEINFKLIEGLEANNQRALIVHRQVINKPTMDQLGYTSMFDAAYPDFPPSLRYSRETAGMAIAAYQRTILTNQAPFQLWLKGDETAMTETQKKGALLFFGKAGCINCHKSPSLNSMEFQGIGVNNLFQSGFDVFRTDANDRRNLGRGGFTYQEADMFKFKVPQLYNLKNVGFYFHGASKRTLREVVEYFNNGIPENKDVPKTQISPFFRPIGLTEQEITELTEFLENGLYDPNLERYMPGRTLSGNCFPNNDYVSKLDLHCK